MDAMDEPREPPHKKRKLSKEEATDDSDEKKEAEVKTITRIANAGELTRILDEQVPLIGELEVPRVSFVHAVLFFSLSFGHLVGHYEAHRRFCPDR